MNNNKKSSIKNVSCFHSSKMNKKGWMRILEATIALLVVSSILVIVNTKQPDRTVDAGEYVYNIQRELLNEISLSTLLREDVLTSIDGSVSSKLSLLINSRIPLNFGSRLKICELTNPPTPCKLNATDFLSVGDGDIFVEDLFISANYSLYSPKKVRLFIWEKR